MRQNEKIPEDTPVWLTLHAFMRYLSIDQKQRNILFDILEENGVEKSFFENIIEFNSQTLPTDEELDLIEKSFIKLITEHVAKISQKRNVDSYKKKEQTARQEKLLSVLKAQIEVLHTFVAKQQQSKPHDVALSLPRTRDMDFPYERGPNERTSKELSLNDIYAFLSGKLQPTYSYLSDLMDYFKANTPQNLEKKFNEILKAEDTEEIHGSISMHVFGNKNTNKQTHDFQDRTLKKLERIEDNMDYLLSEDIALEIMELELIENFIRAAKIQRCDTVEQLKDAIRNGYGENITDAQSQGIDELQDEHFEQINKLVQEALEKFHKRWGLDTRKMIDDNYYNSSSQFQKAS